MSVSALPKIANGKPALPVAAVLESATKPDLCVIAEPVGPATI